MLVSKRTIFSAAVAVVLCMFVSKTASVEQSNKIADRDHLDLTSVVEISTHDKQQYDSALAEDACDCGPNSNGCHFENGTKVCECKFRYRQENEECKPFCKDSYYCDNGAQCVNNSCQCLPGTSGNFCDRVEECEGIKGPLKCGDPDKVLCRYDTEHQKTFCLCRIFEYEYYPKGRTCVECDCGKFGSCSLIGGIKTCRCNEGAALKKDSFWGDTVYKCAECGCGENSDGCSFDEYTKICKCHEGYVQQPGVYGGTCSECSCEPHGQCYFEGWYQYCKCDEGYASFLNINRTELTCKECDCGKNGKCSFVEEVKQCKCNPGYAERDGICTACQCYAANETVECTFTDKIQTCLCPTGYETSKFFCLDIDECLNGSHSCPPSSTYCVNTIGSYRCFCKNGYELKIPGSDPKIDGCVDINECEDSYLCPRNHTVCVNLPGSYKCACEFGYEPVPPNTTPEGLGCQKRIKKELDDGLSRWKITLIVLGVVICFCFFVLLVKIIIRRSARRSPVSMETPFHNMRN